MPTKKGNKTPQERFRDWVAATCRSQRCSTPGCRSIRLVGRDEVSPGYVCGWCHLDLPKFVPGQTFDPSESR